MGGDTKIHKQTEAVTGIECEGDDEFVCNYLCVLLYLCKNVGGYRFMCISVCK